MSTYETKLKKMIFDYSTTYLTDFRIENGVDNSYKTVYKPKPIVDKAKFNKPVKDVHTMTEWKAESIPFDVLIKPKEIIRTNPHQPQKPYSETRQDNELAIKTRPRLVMSPALSIDDADPVARSLIVNDVYTSETTRSLKEGVLKTRNVTAPLPDLPTPAKPLDIPKLREPVVPHEWRMESILWDRNQRRSYCDATQRFWLKLELPKCRSCDESQAVNSQIKGRWNSNWLKDDK